MLISVAVVAAAIRRWHGMIAGYFRSEQVVEEGKPSATALAAAALRAAHLEDARPLVFDDKFAIELTSEDYRQMHSRGELASFFASFGVRPIQGQVLGRARYAEEALERAVTRGIAQYVLLGAGLDAFILRRPELLQSLSVFELDHPDTQAYKLQRLADIGYAIPANVEFIAVDFETQDVYSALEGSAYQFDQRAFFSWLGVVSYLTMDAINESLQAIRRCSVPGSELLLDFPVSEEFIEASELSLTDKVKKGTADMGEARPVQHNPGEFIDTLDAMGFELIENLTPAQHRQRYFSNRDDDLRPYPEIHLAHFRVKY